MHTLHLLHMMHVLHVLTSGYLHIRSPHRLLGFYLGHDARQFLLSGITSESPRTPAQALALLRELTAQRIAPVDW